MTIPKLDIAAPFVAILIVFAGLTSTVPVQAKATPLGQSGCPSGTAVSGKDFVFNGNFAQGSTGFQTDLPDRGPGIYPSDPPGGFSIQTGNVSYWGGGIIGRPFGGDAPREVLPSETYFYSNPDKNKDGTPFSGLLWRQNVTGLLPDTTYNFYGYFDNLLAPITPGFDPKIELRVDGAAAGPPIIVLKEPDTWIPIEFSFRTALGQTSVLLEVYSLTNENFGDDFAMTGLSLRQCSPALGVAKQALVPVPNQDGSWTVSYRITVRVYGNSTTPLTQIQVTDNLATTFATAASWSLESVTSSTLKVNPAYNGRTEIRLLAGTDKLLPNIPATINLRVRVTPGTGPNSRGPFYNTATASGIAGTIIVRDVSTPGNEPDRNGNGNPKEKGEDIPTEIILNRLLQFLPQVWR